ncbi:MAG: carbohydrate ABC transporter permease [Sphaerochaeta sp.]|jgi:ABC-type glycerol-3-phosphate transport system permease component|uniref:carbohydrate ABC transporter permease n=1 Tax=Sphaerochaeta sp. TaxID=1972642 RepID=UPI0018456A39|nr:carbohydrate ABC transporter permease [Sphaerochaeta sp.]NCC13934.1 carbohydrate ABC transporter permease [Spirochaetia bacterium]NLA97848.1 carbohydrate ABC transporter permease [Spirochaetales bacterium]MDD3930407.1 carbohydrate ABC transporter permease [Sphaerochaeta sp.]MDX9985205.1 carbohydrate ABC transporter permease [Sphaerochaeta sp.]HPE93684.1 carbohydrate ABC transporter permease [Sphaerochaeta sp.]
MKTETTFEAMKRAHRRRQITTSVVTHSFMILLSVIFLLPIFWMFSTAIKSRWDIFLWPPVLFPEVPQWVNFRDVFTRVPMFRFIGNTFYLIVLKTIGELLAVPLIAYGFARLKFPGKGIFFMLVISTMMIPLQTKLIPLYSMYVKAGMIDTYWPLVLPAFSGTPFFIFLLIQYMKTMPRDLDDAAKIDGVGTFGILYRILLPLCIPALTIIVTYTFLWTWNEFLQPLIYLNSYEKFTIQMGLEMFKGIWSVEWNLLMAATLSTMTPVLVMYFFAQKHLIGGIASVGMKG